MYRFIVYDYRLTSAFVNFFPSFFAFHFDIQSVIFRIRMSVCLYCSIDYCSTESFHAHCPSGTVVLMTSARYGRMRLGRCVRVDFGFIGCSTDVIHILDRHCSGRTECRLRVPDAEMDDTRPCLGDLTRYLEASYECIPGWQIIYVFYRTTNLAPSECLHRSCNGNATRAFCRLSCALETTRQTPTKLSRVWSFCCFKTDARCLKIPCTQLKKLCRAPV